MTRITAAMCALGLATAVAASAQDTTVKTTTQTTGEAKTISYTGCVAAGTEVRTFMLNKVVPVTRTTETVGTSGTTTVKTETTYMLVPGDKVEIQPHVGRKVEVSGVLIPETDVKTTTSTTDRADAGTTVTETTKSEKKPSQFRVVSIKDLAEPCN